MILLKLDVLPRSKQSFKYDHLRKEASDYKPWSADSEAEGLRSAIEADVASYVKNHYNHGVSAVFSKEVILQWLLALSYLLSIGRQMCCCLHWGPPIQSKKFLEWTMAQPVDCDHQWKQGWSSGDAQSPGQLCSEAPPLVLKQNARSTVHFLMRLFKVHYYEEGNVQLVSSKEVRCFSDVWFWFWRREILLPCPGLRWRIASPWAMMQRLARLSSTWWRTLKRNTRMASVRTTRWHETIYVNTLDTDFLHYQSFCTFILHFQTMSDTTFKALRRALPVTKTKVGLC